MKYKNSQKSLVSHILFMTALNVQKACKKSDCLEMITHCKLQVMWHNFNPVTNKSLLNILFLIFLLEKVKVVPNCCHWGADNDGLASVAPLRRRRAVSPTVARGFEGPEAEPSKPDPLCWAPWHNNAPIFGFQSHAHQDGFRNLQHVTVDHC